MNGFPASQFFDLEGFEHAELFTADAGVWSALGERLKHYLAARQEWPQLSELPPGVHLLGAQVAIGRGCRFEPGAVIVGPAVIGDGVLVRTGAYIREHFFGAYPELKEMVAHMSDDDILAMRIRDLGLQIQGSWLEPHIDRLYGELCRKVLRRIGRFGDDLRVLGVVKE